MSYRIFSLGEANCADLVIVQRPEAVDPYYALAL